MSDWLHNLPLPGMALVIFGFTYSLAGALFAAIMALATGERAKSFKTISPGMLPVLGIIFGLFVAFIAAQVWGDSDRGSAAVGREASALRTAVLLASGLPAEHETRFRGAAAANHAGEARQAIGGGAPVVSCNDPACRAAHLPSVHSPLCGAGMCVTIIHHRSRGDR